MHQLSISRLLLKQLVVPGQQFVVLGDRLLNQELLSLQDQLGVLIVVVYRGGCVRAHSRMVVHLELRRVVVDGL